MSSPMYYVGVDLHKHQSWFYVTDALGKKLHSKSVSNKEEQLKEFFDLIPKPFKLAVEATFNCHYFISIARKYANKVYLSDSYELKAFAKRNKKTDKIDARLISDILRKGFLPSVTIADNKTLKLREFLHCRVNMVRSRSQTIARLKGLLDRQGKDSSGNFNTLKRLYEIELLNKTNKYYAIIKGYIDAIHETNEKIKIIEHNIRQLAIKDKDIVNLMTIPGLSYFSASIIKSEVINIERFMSFNRLCSYAGLAPKIYQSANKIIRGRLNKNRRKYLQWILLETVTMFKKAMPKKITKYERISKRKNKNTAKVAIARDMLKIIYKILKEKRPFYKNIAADVALEIV